MVGYNSIPMVVRKFGVTIIVVTLSIYVLLTLVDPSEVADTFASARVLPYLVGIVLFYVTFPIRAKRWQILLGGVNTDADTNSATLIILVSWFLNTLLPAKAGDLHRSYLARQNYSTTKATAFGTIAAERVIDLFVLILGLLVTMVLVVPSITSLNQQIILTAIGLLIFVSIGVAVILLFEPSLLPSAVVDVIGNFRKGLTAITSLRELVVVLAITLIMWSVNVFRMGFVAVSVGVDISLPMLVLVALLVAFLSGLPYTPAGIGVVEVVTTSVIVASTGITESIGVTFVLFDRLITVGSLVIVGAVVYTYLKFTAKIEILAKTDASSEDNVKS
jgi:uncharacterized protein (TIRG00374 family)